MAKLNPKQQRFCEEYLIDLNATQAAIRAGYSPLAAAEIGSRLLTIAKVRAYIAIMMAERSKRTGINADRVLREIARLAFVNITDVVNCENATLLVDASEDDTAAIISIKVRTKSGEDFDETEREIKLADKTKNLELLMKHLGMIDTAKNKPPDDDKETGVLILPAVDITQPDEPDEGGADNG